VQPRFVKLSPDSSAVCWGSPNSSKLRSIPLRDIRDVYYGFTSEVFRRCVTTPFLAPYYAKKDHFTKTGSGQTQGKIEGKKGRFLQEGAGGAATGARVALLLASAT
jgi:hypothetical protein